MAITLNGSTGIVEANVADNAITTNKIASGAVDVADLASSLDLSSKTLTLPTTLTTPLVPLQTIQLSGLTNFTFSVSAYPMYKVFFTNLGGSAASANVYLKASYDDGSTYPANWNYRTRLFFVNGANSDNYNNGGNANYGWVWNDIWNGAAPSGTHGELTISGTSYYGQNKRLTYTGVFSGQQQGGQGMELQMGQTQDDSHTYNRVYIGLTSGTFYGLSTALICGVKAQ